MLSVFSLSAQSKPAPNLLFIFADDPHELYDFAPNPEYGSTLRELRQALRAPEREMKRGAS